MISFKLIMKLIILLFSILFCSTSTHSSNREEIEGIKKYFGFPFPLTGRRWSSGQGSNHQNDKSAEPRNGSEKPSNEKLISEELISRSEKVISDNEKVISDNEKQSTGSDNHSILKIMKELNSIRKIVDQMAKDQMVKDPIVIDPMVKTPPSLFSDHQDSDKYQEGVSSFSAESNYELLNTLGAVLGSRKSCPENSFRCSSDTSSTSIFSILPTSSSSSSSSSSGSLKPSVSLTQTSASFVAMFPGMRTGQEPKCIPPEKVCDGIKDCPNKDDESELRCRCWQESGHYKCKGMNEKKCIPKSWLCDGVEDCSFGDDEDSSLCSQSLGQPSGRVMNDKKMAGQKLILEYICLGPFSKYQNKTNVLIPLSSPRQVIPIRWLCDGEQDCEKGDDEKFCDPPYPVKAPLPVIVPFPVEVPFPALSPNGSSFNSTSTNGSSFIDSSINGTSINSNGSVINLLEVINGTTMTNGLVMSDTMNGTGINETVIDTITSSSPLSSSSPFH